MSRCRNLTKKEQRQVLKEVQALADKYNVSLVSISNVIAKVINPYGSKSFRIPEEKKLKHMLPEVMIDFITTIPDLNSYHVCEVRDMVIEKFPDNGYSNRKIYYSCYYVMNKETYKKAGRDWAQANKEAVKAGAKASWARREAIRKETMKERKKTMAIKICQNYCGITCVNGNCPNALDDMDRRSDTDAYAAYHLDKKQPCNKCGYYKGCEDCCFAGTEMCTKEEDLK